MNIKTSAEQAIALWEELTGKSVRSTSYSFSINGESFDLYGANKRVQQALEIADDVTVGLIIKTLSQHLAESESFTLADILNGNQRLQSRIELVQRMNALFSDADLVGQHEAFYRYCEGALAHYRNLPTIELPEKSREFVRDSGCFVGLDAYHGVNKLTRLMICDGPISDGADAKVSQFVFAFQSIEDLITHARRIPTGFSLCVILAEHISDSYFAMVVRNGQRILVLTDKGNYTHPLQQERMRNRNDRYNLNRIESSHFPYSLLDIEWGDNGRRASKGGTGTDLMLSDSGLHVLGNLSDLNDWDLLWLHLFIDQCRHRYFDQKQTEPQLAIGSMIRLPHKWLPAEPNLPVPVEFELKLDTRTSAELNTEFMQSIEPEWKETYNPNLWMEKRFAGQVPNEALYIPSGALTHETPLLSYDGGTSLERRDVRSLPFWEKNELPLVRLHPLEQTALSTPERVIRDAHFIARANQAEIIQELANADYKKRKDEIVRWWYKAAAKNIPNILGDLLALNHARFHIDTDAHKAVLMQLGRAAPCAGKASNVRLMTNYRSINLDYVPRREHYRYLPREKGYPSLANALKLEDYSYARYRCAVEREEDAQLFLCLTVSCVLDLMNIAGLTLDEIPPELHHIGVTTYQGNSILDRIDPLGGVSNPWDKITLGFRLPVSLKAFKSFRRERGLETPKASELIEFAKEGGSQAYTQNQSNDNQMANCGF